MLRSIRSELESTSSVHPILVPTGILHQRNGAQRRRDMAWRSSYSRLRPSLPASVTIAAGSSMWLAIEANTGRTVDQPFNPALRTALQHRIGDDEVWSHEGHVVTAVFPAHGRAAPSRRIIATYTCISGITGMGEGSTWRATYTNGTGRIQWIRIYWCRSLGAWRANSDEFTIYPD